MADDVVLAAEDLRKAFGRVRAVDGLSFSVRRGDFYGFVGRNGAGKTTTLRMLTGLVRPDGGVFRFGGERTTTVRPHHRARLAALVESPSFFGRLSGLDNLLGLGRLSGPLTRADAARLLEQVGLADAARRPAATYSLGMKQRLALALSLAGRPDVILLDEPTNGLDPAGVRDLRETLRRLHRERGLTLMVSSHLLSEVERLATRLGVVRDGRIAAEGTPEELLRADGRVVVAARPLDRAASVLARFGVTTVEDGRLVVRAAPDASRAAMTRALVEAGVEVDAVAPAADALERLVLGAEAA
ncbi:MAG TPA: ABC transporter ATP-binding protein [Planctomycetota bacterium]|nr:ABC transporter ATP-binding protein [Planctomycetota bacterium]